MPPHFEEAAHLLQMMTAKGLVIRSPSDCLPVILRIARAVAEHRATDLSHAAAAGRLLGELEVEELATYAPRRHATLVAMLGSFIGNALSLTERRATHENRFRA